MRETWISGENWRWDGSLGAYTLLRISSNAAVYDQNPNSMIPLRLKMLANVVFAPIEGAPRRETIRTASVEWKGSQITCILTSAGGNPQIPANGRQWFETEYCIDPATGLLDLPEAITITENGTAVMTVQLTSIADQDPANTSLFTPTAQMISQGTATALQLVQRELYRARSCVGYGVRCRKSGQRCVAERA